MAYNFLIVDDSTTYRKILKRIIKQTKLDIAELFEADHGGHAMEVLSNTPIDLIFLDINMPFVDGMEFMQLLSSNTSYREIPVIVISTEGSTDRCVELDKLGVRMYLRKPSSPEEIARTVHEVLDARGA